MSTQPPQPIVVNIKTTCVMLSMSKASVFKLIKNQELVSYLEGKTRKITVQSIYDYVNRKIEKEPTLDSYSVRLVSQPGV